MSAKATSKTNVTARKKGDTRPKSMLVIEHIEVPAPMACNGVTYKLRRSWVPINREGE